MPEEYYMDYEKRILQGEEKKNFEKRLNQLVEKADFHLATGFLSTPFLLSACHSSWNDRRSKGRKGDAGNRKR